MIRRLFLGFVVVLFTASLVHAQMVSVARDKVNMRSGPGLSYSILWELGQGYPLQVIDRKGGWLKIKDFENDVGWIHAKLVNNKAHLVVKKQRINIRSKPGLTSRVLGKAEYGEVLRTLKQSNGWVQVKRESGLTGWVKRDLVWGW